jgi:signal transduction histidine kinase
MKRIIKGFRIDKRIRVGYGTAFGILLMTYLLTLYSNREAQKLRRSIDDNNKIIQKFDDFLSLMKDAEMGSRGYLRTRDTALLASYAKSHLMAAPSFYKLQEEIMDKGTQSVRLQKAKTLMDRKYAITDSTIDVFNHNSYVLTDSLLEAEKKGKMITDSLKKAINEMQVYEQTEQIKETKKLDGKYHFFNIVTFISFCIALLLFVFGYITYARENKARRLADLRTAEYKEALEQRVTELNRANKELIEMRRLEKFTATGRIARTIAHEVRNPLTNINLSVDQLKSEIDASNEDREVFYDMIMRNSHRINALITELLDSTKFIELKAESVSVNKLLDEALAVANDSLTLNNITLVKQYSSDICEISADIEKMKIAFLNIIVNGVEAMEPGKGILTITTLSRHNKCIVEINDNGSGMDNETLNKLFEPYYSKKTKGNGLGLTNTENIILSHKGSIHVESTLGKGTRFIITLDFT